MGRIILAVISGYVVMALAINLLFAAAFAALGVERILVPGTYDPSYAWITTSVVLGTLGAMAGGWLSARLGGHAASKWLAGVVTVLGLLMAIPVVTNSDPARGGVRPDGATVVEVLSSARQPGWVAVLNPFIGAAGVLIGGRLRRA